MSNRKWRYLDNLMILLFIIGITVFFYPFISDAVNDYLDQQMIKRYQKEAEQKSKKEAEKIWEKYVENNKKLAQSGYRLADDPFREVEEISQSKESTIRKHMIGVLTIPKINVHLPIFDQTTSLLLEKGAALLKGSSYPSGGESTHAVLSSHRGLTKAKLFTDLDKLKENDLFFIESQNKKLAYRIDQIKIVEPTDSKDLLIEEGQDYVTLLTCTPYMVNSHRLLVRGRRVVYKEQEIEKNIQKVTKEKKKFFVIGVVVFLLLIGGMMCFICYFKD